MRVEIYNNTGLVKVLENDTALLDASVLALTPEERIAELEAALDTVTLALLEVLA
jgi:hypothetical protein